MVEDVSELPELVTLYRGGGTDDVDFPKDGFSWTSNRAVAAWYARHRYAQGRQAAQGGSASILTVTIPRDKVALWTRAREAEVVVVHTDGAEIDTTCAETIHRLAEVASPIFDNPKPDSEILRLTPIGDDGWHGWTGDE